MNTEKEIKNKFNQIIGDIKLVAMPMNKINQKATVKFNDTRVSVIWDFKHQHEIKHISFELSKDLAFEMDLHENGNFTLTKYSKDEYPYLALKDEVIIEFLNEIESNINKIKLSSSSVEFIALDFLT